MVAGACQEAHRQNRFCGGKGQAPLAGTVPKGTVDATKIADDIGVRVQFVRTERYFILPALVEEEFDVIVSGMSITPKRRLHVNFSIPYSEFGRSIVANTARTPGLTSLADFNTSNVVFAATRPVL